MGIFERNCLSLDFGKFPLYMHRTDKYNPGVKLNTHERKKERKTYSKSFYFSLNITEKKEKNAIKNRTEETERKKNRSNNKNMCTIHGWKRRKKQKKKQYWIDDVEKLHVDMQSNPFNFE